MKKLILIIAGIVLIGVCTKAKNQSEIIIPDNALRFRVIANSNTPEDYQTKLIVKRSVETKLTELLESASTLAETKEIIKQNLDLLNNLVSSALENSDTDFKIDFGNNDFPKKIFKGVVYPEGKYDSLVITIGKGAGENWWCVLFPPLCLLEENTTSDVEYQFYVSRIINYFK